MRIGISSPYIDTGSGGERYILTLASWWSRSHTVSIFWDRPEQVHEVGRKLNLDLSRLEVTANIFARKSRLLKYITSSHFDCIIFLSDGSVPFSLAKYNILHFQMPFPMIRIGALKMSRYQAIVCNSEFTKRNLDEPISKVAEVIYPPVSIPLLSDKKKERIILSVGRLHPVKKHDILIKSFLRLKRFLPGWRLIIAGGLIHADETCANDLIHLATSGDIEIVPNSSYETLKDLYARASIYWHATGYLSQNPQEMEHFGIAPVEAMAAGCVPIVFNGGGLPEIVSQGRNGFLWKNDSELEGITRRLASDKHLLERMGIRAMKRAEYFSAQHFCDAFDTLLLRITK